MAKSNKGKGPKPAKSFNDNALEQLTARIGNKLKEKDHKRKNPPTNDSESKDTKRQRNSSSGPAKSGEKGGDDDLLGEIKALGGDEKDLELIQDIDSEDELNKDKDQKHAVDKSLKDELAALSKSLGFAEYQPSEASDEEEPEEGEDDEDDEGPSEFESESDNVHEEAVVKKIPGGMHFEPRADWHVASLAKLPKPAVDHIGPFTVAIEALKSHAKVLLEEDAVKYRTSIFASSSHKFLSTIMSSGTLNDKVSALTLAIQESPVHNIRAFDALLTLASKKSRGQAMGAISALVDLLGPGSMLPSDRRLRHFSAQPGLIGSLQKTNIKTWRAGQPLPGKLTDAHLISWIFEDWLKDIYFKIIQLLESWCSDEIEYSRSRALDFVYGLLKEKPEQESNLLRLLVNKLGDRERKIASRSSYLLLQLQTSHPGMKPIIVRMIEQEILLHPSQDHRSKYYAINTLNQTILSSKEPTVAETLMRVYFELFVGLLKGGSLGAGFENHVAKKNDTENPDTVKKPGKPGVKKPSEQDIEAADKMVSAILTGVNRAAPFVGSNDGIMENHLDTLFKIAHSANFNTGIQALLLIQHLSSARSLGTDRFYRTLYESLLDPRLVSSSKHALYLNLLLRALKNDVDVRRVKAFAKRMLQISCLHQPPFVCGLLYVISSLKETFPDLYTLIKDPEESVFDDEPVENRPVYDGRKRDPEYSNAQRSCLWEVIPVQSHFHPSVSVFAAALVDKGSKVQKPDLDSHSLIRFLDKFVYRNPKATDSARGASIMQPLRATKDLGDKWLGSRPAGSAIAATSVNSMAFRNKKHADVAAEDVFFHEYFQHVTKEPKKPKASKAEDGDEEDGEEDEIWKALVDANPNVDGDDAGSEGFDDLDEDEMASDDNEEAFDLDDSDMDDDLSVDIESDGGVDIEGTDDEAGDGELVAVGGADSDDEKKDDKKDERKERRKKMKALPMFASVDDYAELLGQEEDEDFR